jgi:phosphatidylglycerol:prolipoprotein diacylglycerol transferase
MIALGLITFIFFTYRHPLRKKLLSDAQYTSMISWGVMAALIGGRLFEVISSWELFKDNPIEILYPWVGGFGILGAIFGGIIVIPPYLRWHRIPILQVFDILILYVPLMQAIGRIGCFFAGCCYGTYALQLWWAVTYTDPASLAPLHIPLHPAQLYMSAASLLVFLLLFFFIRPLSRRPGQLLFGYLILESTMRFIMEWWRADSVYVHTFGQYFDMMQVVSSAQLVALLLCCIGVIGLWGVSRIKSDHNVHDE